MTTGWVAGSVRARAMSRRRLGHAAVEALAASPSLEAALEALSDGPYGHDVHAGQSLPEAEHAVQAALLWNLRVLAGWLPRDGASALRAVAAWFELLNVEGHLQELAGETAAARPFQLGSLATAWPRLSGTRSIAELRQVLATSAWGDPGDDTPHQVQLVLRARYGQRVASSMPDARPWAVSAVALLFARESFLANRPVADPLQRVTNAVLGLRAAQATSLPAMQETADADIRELLGQIDDVQDLWRLELDWWRRVERDAFGLLRQPRHGSQVVCGGIALLAVDAWRVTAALELAARGGGRLPEAHDVVA